MKNKIKLLLDRLDLSIESFVNLGSNKLVKRIDNQTFELYNRKLNGYIKCDNSISNFDIEYHIDAKSMLMTISFDKRYIDSVSEPIMNGIMKYSVPSVERGLRDGDIILYNGEIGIILWVNYAYRMVTLNRVSEPVGLFLDNTNFIVLYRYWRKTKNEKSNTDITFTFKNIEGENEEIRLFGVNIMARMECKGVPSIFKYYEDLGGYALTESGKKLSGLMSYKVKDIIMSSIYMSTYDNNKRE